MFYALAKEEYKENLINTKVRICSFVLVTEMPHKCRQKPTPNTQRICTVAYMYRHSHGDIGIAHIDNRYCTHY